MKRLKTFFTYAILIVAFWIVSNLIIYISIKGTYKYIESRIYTQIPEIIVSDSKATYINGYVKGSIKNNTDEIINDKYLKIDCYSARDVKLGTKYIKVNNLLQNETMDYEIYFKFTDVKYTNVYLVDIADEEVEETEFISEKASAYVIIGTLIVLFFI